MQIVCRHCGEQLGEEHINQELNIVTCAYCDAVFSVPIHDSKKRGIDVSEVPEGLRIIRGTTGIRITRLRLSEKTASRVSSSKNNTNGCVTIIMFIFCCPVLLFMPYVEALEAGATMQEFVFSTLGIIIVLTLILIFTGAENFLKRRSRPLLELNNSSLKTNHWRTSLNSKEIRQIYVKQGILTAAYKIYAIMKNGKHKHILNINKVQEALFIEHEIETYLGITDYPVEGEYH